MKEKTKRSLAGRLKEVSFGYALLKLLRIPVSLRIATHISDTIACATVGNVKGTLGASLRAMLWVAALTLVNMIFELFLRRRAETETAECRVHFLENVLGNPLDRLFRVHGGALLENLGDDVAALTKRYTKLLPAMIASAAVAVVYTIFLGMQSLSLALLLLALSLLQLIPPMIVKKYMKTNYDDCRDMEAAITDHVAEAVTGMEAIKLFDLRPWWSARLEKLYRDYLRVGSRSDALASVQGAMYQLLDNLLKFGTYALAGFYAMTKLCSPEVAIQAIYLSGELFSSVKALFQTIPDFALSNRAEQRLLQWNAPIAKEALPVKNGAGEICLDSLHYGYEEKELLCGICASLHCDRNYLITGANGAGKSTLLNLLTGLLKPAAGKIQIGEENAAAWNGDERLQIMQYVPQTDPEFSFDALTLLAMLDETKREAALENAEKLGLQISALSGKATCDLSGGERKKLFLAAGFAQGTPWLLLDEPSNHLDAQGKSALCEMIRSRTGVIIISHDQMLRKTADTVLRLENGQVQYEA